MDLLPKPVKLVLYALTFILVLMGGSSAVSWFTPLGLGLIFYAILRLVSMDCIHRYTGLPVALMVFLTGLIGLKTPQTIGLLGLVMFIDIIV